MSQVLVPNLNNLWGGDYLRRCLSHLHIHCRSLRRRRRGRRRSRVRRKPVFRLRMARGQRLARLRRNGRCCCLAWLTLVGGSRRG